MADIRDLLTPPRQSPKTERDVRRHWRIANDPAWRKSRHASRFGFVQLLLLAIFGGAVLGLASTYVEIPAATFDRAAQASARQFGFCHTGGGTNCVVDGDTFWMDGTRIRIADIDTPETHPARCASEAALGARATERLQNLLNAGPVALEAIDRDEDRFGRKLRIVVRDGRSLGETLVIEGLARRWTGQRQPWCDA